MEVGHTAACLSCCRGLDFNWQQLYERRSRKKRTYPSTSTDPCSTVSSTCPMNSRLCAHQPQRLWVAVGLAHGMTRAPCSLHAMHHEQKLTAGCPAELHTCPSKSLATLKPLWSSLQVRPHNEMVSMHHVSELRLKWLSCSPGWVCCDWRLWLLAGRRTCGCRRAWLAFLICSHSLLHSDGVQRQLGSQALVTEGITRDKLTFAADLHRMLASLLSEVIIVSCSHECKFYHDQVGPLRVRSV